MRLRWGIYLLQSLLSIHCTVLSYDIVFLAYFLLFSSTSKVFRWCIPCHQPSARATSYSSVTRPYSIEFFNYISRLGTVCTFLTNSDMGSGIVQLPKKTRTWLDDIHLFLGNAKTVSPISFWRFSLLSVPKGCCGSKTSAVQICRCGWLFGPWENLDGWFYLAFCFWHKSLRSFIKSSSQAIHLFCSLREDVVFRLRLLRRTWFLVCHVFYFVLS